MCLTTCLYSSNIFSQCFSGYEDGFEAPEFSGFWQNLSDDDFDWTQKSGQTSSSSTGPLSANEGNFYLYTESSSPNYGNKVARVSVFDQSVQSNLSGFEVTFDYHMYGSSMGTLELIAYEFGNLNSPIVLWQMSGNQGNAWNTAVVNLDQFIGSNLQLVFQGTTANSYRSDMAIDDLIFTECTGSNCNLPPVASFTYINNDPTLTFVPGSVIGDNFIWDFGDGTSQTQTIDQLVNTLPDHTYNANGTYTVCMTALKNGCPSDQTCQNVTISGICNTVPISDFSINVGSSSVDVIPGSVIGDNFILDFGDGTSLSLTYAQLTSTPIVHNYSANGNYTVCLTALINNCTTTDQSCQNVTISGVSTGGGSCLNSYVEGFETPNPSGWQNLQNDDIDWTLRSGGTPSSNTGPSAAIEGNYYLYVETSGSNSGGKTAEIYAHYKDLTSSSLTDVAFNFDYHMYGSTMGTLNLIAYINGDTSNPVTLWSLSGNQGNNWIQASVSLNPYIGSNIELHFQAITGSSYRSDMAIDNITMDECSGNSNCNTVPISDFSYVSSNDPSFLFFPGSVIGDTFIWDFGIGNLLTQNGTQIANNPPTYTYPANGTYTVCLTAIIDGCPGQDQSCQNVTVSGVNSGGSGCISAQPLPYFESFENGISTFTQNTDDDMNWTSKSGGTSSSSTGPLGAYNGTYYVYVEASGNANKVASITSPCFDLTSTNAPEFSFQRNMRGAHMGSLSIDFYGNGQWFNDVMVLSSTTATSGAWAAVGGSIYGLESGMTNCNDCKIRLRATVGSSYQSDIAVDQFEIFDGSTMARLGSNDNDQSALILADFTLFPNPATNNVNLSFEDVEQMEQVIVSNIMGQTVSVGYTTSNAKDINLDISNLDPGYYFVTVLYNFGKTKSKKLIVE